MSTIIPGQRLQHAVAHVGRVAARGPQPAQLMPTVQPMHT